MENNLLSLLHIPTVSNDVHYWIIRTNGGEYYEDFVMHKYISISWDYVSLNTLYNKTDDEIKRLIDVYEQMSSNKTKDDDTEEPSKGKTTTILNKINRFVFEINKDDIILIPSKNSNRITIAKVTSDVYETEHYVETYLKENPETEIIPCPYRKRRKIKAIRTITKGQMDIYLTKGFSSQHALSNMDEYAPYINRTIYGVYSKDNQLHTTLHAGHPNGLNLKELVELSTYIEKASYALAEQCEIPFDSSQIKVKLNIHSPGLIELIGAMAGDGIVLSLLIFSINNILNGGKLNISFKKNAEGNLDFSVNSESSGIYGNSQKNKRIELTEKTQLLEIIDKLDVKTPEIVSAILNGDKITPQMISNAQTTDSLNLESKKPMTKLIETQNNTLSKKRDREEQG